MKRLIERPILFVYYILSDTACDVLCSLLISLSVIVWHLLACTLSCEIYEARHITLYQAIAPEEQVLEFPSDSVNIFFS